MNPQTWHKVLARMAGTISLRIEKRTLSKSELLSWSAELKKIAEEMLTKANGEKK